MVMEPYRIPTAANITKSKITVNTAIKITENIEIYHSHSRRHGHKPTHRRTAETDREDIGCIQKMENR